jgi:ABC-2 type transport system ATP-binding protein
MLEVRSLTKYYGVLPAVRDVSFQVPPGDVLGYLGPNGSGKSTTVKMIAGLLTPSDGAVLYEGVSIHDRLLDYKPVVGYVPEETHLYSYLSGPEYLAFVGGLRGLPRTVLDKKIEAFLELFGLQDDRYAPLSSFSKGMRQKILISAALLHNPRIVILDEPCSGLDVTSTLVLKSLVRQLSAEGKIVLYSSHVLEMVEQVCSRVVILFEGRVVAHDSVASLRGMMDLPNLEQVFRKLVVRRDVDRVAADLVGAMKL